MAIARELSKPKYQNLEKAAILLITLESSAPGSTSKIMTILGEEKAKILLEKISSLGKINAERKNEIVSEFYGLALENQYVFGGMDVSSKILKETYGINKAQEFFKSKKEKFRFFEEIDYNSLKEYLETETDQMKLFIFNFLSPRKASELLTHMDDELLPLKLIKNLTIPNMDILYDFEMELSAYFNTQSSDTGSNENEHLQKLASMIEFLPSSHREKMLQSYRQSSAEFAAKLESLVFTFEEFITITDQVMQALLFEISDFRLIGLIRLQTSPELVDKINRCLTDRTKEIVESESIGLEKKASIDQVEEAKRKVVSLARQLEKKGAMKLKHG